MKQLPIEPQSHSKQTAGQRSNSKRLGVYGSKDLGVYGSMGSKGNELAVFRYARKAKTEEPNATLNRKLQLFRTWHAENLPRVDFDDAWPAFLRAFAGVKFKEGEGPLHDAYRKALKYPVDLPGLSAKSPRRVFAALCRELQNRVEGDPKTKGQPFLAGTHQIAALFGVSHRAISSWLTELVELGIISRHSRGSFEEHKAGMYYFNSANATRGTKS